RAAGWLPRSELAYAREPKSAGGWRIPESACQRCGGRCISAQAIADREASANAAAATVGVKPCLTATHYRAHAVALHRRHLGAGNNIRGSDLRGHAVGAP